MWTSLTTVVLNLVAIDCECLPGVADCPHRLSSLLRCRSLWQHWASHGYALSATTLYHEQSFNIIPFLIFWWIGVFDYDVLHIPCALSGCPRSATSLPLLSSSSCPSATCRAVVRRSVRLLWPLLVALVVVVLLAVVRAFAATLDADMIEDFFSEHLCDEVDLGALFLSLIHI